MVFNSTQFLFIFLPLALLVYYLVPESAKNLVLLAASLVFYAWGVPAYLILLVVSIGFNYFIGLQFGRCRKMRQAKSLVVLGVGVNLALMIFFRYLGAVIHALNGAFGLNLAGDGFPVPVGIVIFTLQAISYQVDLYRRQIRPERDLVHFSLYMCMFPRILVGPLISYGDLKPQMEGRKLTWDKLGEGLMRFVRGLAKKVLLADQAASLFLAVYEMEERAVLTGWLGCLAFGFWIYFTFSGYSDMAIGLGGMFGFELPENFHYPYLARSMTEFWQRFNSSLNDWFRDYVYTPLSTRYRFLLANMGILLFTWMLMGMWYDTTANAAIWGLYCGVIVLLEGFVFGGIADHIPAVIRILLTNFLVLIGWVFFFSPSPAFLGTWLGQMFGVGALGFLNSGTTYLLGNFWPILLLCLLFALPWARRLYEWAVYGGRRAHPVINSIVYGILFILSAAFVLTGHSYLFVTLL